MEDFISIIIFVSVLQFMLLNGKSYDLKCPSNISWKIRATFKCNSTLKYYCLYNNVEEKYFEGCTGPDWDRKGSKRIFSGSFTRADCKHKRFQPFIFWTNGSLSDCVFAKSKCNEEGQLVNKDESANEDRTCRCGYEKNYTFIKTPRNICFCIPTREDCACYHTTYSTNSSISADNGCTQSGNKENKNRTDIIMWVGFKDSNFEGEQSLFLKGNYILSDRPKDQGGFKNDSLSSFSRIMVKPSGKVKLLRIYYDSNKKQVLRKPDEVFKWVQDNHTSIEQMVKRTAEKTKQREDTYEFRWNSSTKVSATVTAKISIPLIEKEGIKMTAEETFDVGSTTGTKTVKVQKFVVEYPSKIPPYSRITLTSKVTEGKIDIPFTAFMCYEDNPDHVTTEQGVFYGCQYFDFHTEFHETKLPRPT